MAVLSCMYILYELYVYDHIMNIWRKKTFTASVQNI